MTCPLCRKNALTGEEAPTLQEVDAEDDDVDYDITLGAHVHQDPQFKEVENFVADES